MKTNAQRIAEMRAFIAARGEASSAEIKEHMGEPTLCVSGLLNYSVNTGKLFLHKQRVPGVRCEINVYRHPEPQCSQPAVEENTGSATSATPLSAQAHRGSPSPSIAQTMARLEGEGEVRYGLGKDGCLAIRDGKTSIQLNRYQTFLLGRLMAGTVSVWGL